MQPRKTNTKPSSESPSELLLSQVTDRKLIAHNMEVRLSFKPKEKGETTLRQLEQLGIFPILRRNTSSGKWESLSACEAAKKACYIDLTLEAYKQACMLSEGGLFWQTKENDNRIYFDNNSTAANFKDKMFKESYYAAKPAGSDVFLNTFIKHESVVTYSVEGYKVHNRLLHNDANYGEMYRAYKESVEWRKNSEGQFEAVISTLDPEYNALLAKAFSTALFKEGVKALRIDRQFVKSNTRHLTYLTYDDANYNRISNRLDGLASLKKQEAASEKQILILQKFLEDERYQIPGMEKILTHPDFSYTQKLKKMIKKINKFTTEAFREAFYQRLVTGLFSDYINSFPEGVHKTEITKRVSNNKTLTTHKQKLEELIEIAKEIQGNTYAMMRNKEVHAFMTYALSEDGLPKIMSQIEKGHVEDPNGKERSIVTRDVSCYPLYKLSLVFWENFELILKGEEPKPIKRNAVKSTQPQPLSTEVVETVETQISPSKIMDSFDFCFYPEIQGMAGYHNYSHRELTERVGDISTYLTFRNNFASILGNSAYPALIYFLYMKANIAIQESSLAIQQLQAQGFPMLSPRMVLTNRAQPQLMSIPPYCGTANSLYPAPVTNMLGYSAQPVNTNPANPPYSSFKK